MPHMYILECADGSFYTGSTKHLPLRLWQHQNGFGANHTKKRLPVKLIYAEEFDRVADAFYREKQVQGWSRSKKIALMNSDWSSLHILSECQNYSHSDNVGGDVGFEPVPLREDRAASGDLGFGSAQPTGDPTSDLKI